VWVGYSRPPLGARFNLASYPLSCNRDAFRWFAAQRYYVHETCFRENRINTNVVCPVMWTYDICAFDTGTYYDYYWQQEAELSLTNRAMLFCKVVDRGIAGRFVRKRRQEVHNTSSELLFSFWYYHLAAILQLNSTLQLNPFIVPISMLTHPPLTSFILNATLSMQRATYLISILLKSRDP